MPDGRRIDKQGKAALGAPFLLKRAQPSQDSPPSNLLPSAATHAHKNFPDLNVPRRPYTIDRYASTSPSDASNRRTAWIPLGRYSPCPVRRLHITQLGPSLPVLLPLHGKIALSITCQKVAIAEVRAILSMSLMSETEGSIAWFLILGGSWASPFSKTTKKKIPQPTCQMSPLGVVGSRFRTYSLVSSISRL